MLVKKAIRRSMRLKMLLKRKKYTQRKKKSITLFIVNSPVSIDFINIITQIY